MALFLGKSTCHRAHATCTLVYLKYLQYGRLWHLLDGQVTWKRVPLGKTDSVVSIGIKGYNSHKDLKTSAQFIGLRLLEPSSVLPHSTINTLRPRQNIRHFADDIFKCIFLNENVWIPIKISLKFVPEGPINNIPVLVQVMAWRRRGDKPLSEPMMVSLPSHICITRTKLVKRV